MAGKLVPLHITVSSRLLEHPHNMATGFLHSYISRRPRKEKLYNVICQLYLSFKNQGCIHNNYTGAIL